GVLSGVDFRGADLRGAVFFNCHFTRVNFRNADLRQAVDALLRGANLDHAYLDELSGKVSAQLWDVPVRQALQVILQAAGYEAFSDQGVLMIRRVPKPAAVAGTASEKPGGAASRLSPASAPSGGDGGKGAAEREAVSAPGTPNAASPPVQVVYVPVPVPVQGAGPYPAYGATAPGMALFGAYGYGPYWVSPYRGYGVSPYHGFLSPWASGYSLAPGPLTGGYAPLPMRLGQVIIY
ncbi:MAG: pentapeptide repeat-containing protein, partial [Armatimonadota bacterium]|nr:pentapeptide repeat-containing protein [Armatimonadota bacterium]